MRRETYMKGRDIFCFLWSHPRTCSGV